MLSKSVLDEVGGLFAKELDWTEDYLQKQKLSYRDFLKQDVARVH